VQGEREREREMEIQTGEKTDIQIDENTKRQGNEVIEKQKA
jgi:hypothetical protein